MDNLSIIKQRAAALITALLIVAIAATVAAILATSEKFAIFDSKLVQQNLQAEQNFLGLVLWSETVLDNAQKSNAFLPMPQSYVLNENFYGAKISARLDDALGFFNINSLADPKNQQVFARLLVYLYPKINLQRANLLASNIGNWVRPSAADEEYLKFKPPYRAPHLLMSDISELNLISGITPEIYTALKPYLIALPNTSNRLNILNIPKALAFALSDSITPEQAQGLLDCQTRAKQTNNAEANMESCFANLRINVDPTITIVTRSDFFLLSGEVLFTNRAIKFMSLLTQGIVNGKMQIKELWQTKIYP